MKRLIIVVLVVFLFVCGSAVSEIFEAGWYTITSEDGYEVSSFYLPDGNTVNLPSIFSITKDDAVRSFTAAPGMYTCGPDFPEGRYTICCDSESEWSSVSIFDTNEDYIIGGNLHSDAGNTIASIEIFDGYTLEVKYGKSHFEPYSGNGIVFD